jgi:hypothetical protein
MKKIPECNAVAEGPTAGDPAQTMQKLTYSGAPRSRYAKPDNSGEVLIAYQSGGASVAQSTDTAGYGGYGI